MASTLKVRLKLHPKFKKWVCANDKPEKNAEHSTNGEAAVARDENTSSLLNSCLLADNSTNLAKEMDNVPDIFSQPISTDIQEKGNISANIQTQGDIFDNPTEESGRIQVNPNNQTQRSDTIYSNEAMTSENNHESLDQRPNIVEFEVVPGLSSKGEPIFCRVPICGRKRPGRKRKESDVTVQSASKVRKHSLNGNSTTNDMTSIVSESNSKPKTFLDPTSNSSPSTQLVEPYRSLSNNQPSSRCMHKF